MAISMRKMLKLLLVKITVGFQQPWIQRQPRSANREICLETFGSLLRETIS